MKNKKLGLPLLLILILTVFLDISNFFVPMPVYTPLFLHGHFLHHVSHSATLVLLGVLIACFGAAQLIGGPILGELSDQYGRKKVLIMALSLGLAGTVLATVSLYFHFVILLFVSRLIIGFSAGTIGISYAVAADYCSGENLAKTIGLISLGPCLASAFAPLIGGHLVDNRYLSVLGYATPFAFMAILFVITLVLLYCFLPADAGSREKKRITPLSGFSNIKTVIQRSSSLRRMVFMAALFQIGTEGFFLAAPIIAVKAFHLSPSQIGNNFLLFALSSSVCSLFLNQILSKRLKSTTIYLVFIVIMIAGFALAYTGNGLLFKLAFLLFGAGGMMCWVHTNNLFSSMVNQEEQGLIMGVSQGMWSLGGVISSVLIGFIAQYSYQATGVLLISVEVVSFIMMLGVIKSLKKKQGCSKRKNVKPTLCTHDA